MVFRKSVRGKVAFSPKRIPWPRAFGVFDAVDDRRRHLQIDLRSTVLPTPDAQIATHLGGTLPHAWQAPVAAAETRLQHSFIDTAAVIAYAQVQSAGLVRHLGQNVLGTGVAEGISQCLTPDEQYFLLHDRVQRSRPAQHRNLE